MNIHDLPDATEHAILLSPGYGFPPPPAWPKAQAPEPVKSNKLLKLKIQRLKHRIRKAKQGHDKDRLQFYNKNLLRVEELKELERELKSREVPKPKCKSKPKPKCKAKPKPEVVGDLVEGVNARYCTHPKCGELKAFSEFNKRKNGAYGLQ